MKSFRLLTGAVFAAATLPRLAHRGMFVDGVTYASIARNLAEGRGTFWAPFYTATVYPEFHDHPPLGFWLQSLWFRVAGDHLYVERAYSFVVAAATAALIAAIWRRLHEETRVVEHPASGAEFDWLPVLLWIAIPVVSWTVVGNLLETTVALFTTLAVWAALCGTFAPSALTAAGWGLSSGVAVAAAVLTKGPVGLFTLVAPLTFWFLPGARRSMTTLTAQWVAIGLCAVGLIASDVARASLADYVRVQILPAIAGEREVSGSSFTIVKDLVQAVMLPLLGVASVAFLTARRVAKPSTVDRQRAVPFLLLGLAGTLPILVSAKQAGHYVVPAVPLFALAAAVVLAPTIRVVADRWSARPSPWIPALTAAIGVATIGGVVLPNAGRDRARLANLDALDSRVPRGAVIGICPEANGDWGLHAWFERRFRVGLDAQPGRRHADFLKTAPWRDACPPHDCMPTTDPGRELVLMHCERPD